MTLLLLFAACASVPPKPAPQIALDHIWIAVSPGAPERAALERAGFRFDPNVNRHDGQGTASITAEFHNAFLELLWVEPSVRIDSGLERVPEKFALRSRWRTSGWSPFGISVHDTGSAPAARPVPVSKVTAPWMEPGTAMEILTPRDDTTSPSLFVSPRKLPPGEDMNARQVKAELLSHPIGVKRVTAVRLVAPLAYTAIPALTYYQEQGVLARDAGDEWMIELTFDGATRGERKDFRPELPLVIRY